jgi:hypothetical protein
VAPFPTLNFHKVPIRDRIVNVGGVAHVALGSREDSPFVLTDLGRIDRDSDSGVGVRAHSVIDPMWSYVYLSVADSINAQE